MFESLGFFLDNEDTSSTHFWLFEFIKEEAVNPSLLQKTDSELDSVAQDELRREQALVRKAEPWLKPCLYKKR